MTHRRRVPVAPYPAPPDTDAEEGDDERAQTGIALDHGAVRRDAIADARRRGPFVAAEEVPLLEQLDDARHGGGVAPVLLWILAGPHHDESVRGERDEHERTGCLAMTSRALGRR